LISFEQAASGYADMYLIGRVHHIFQADSISSWQYGPLKISAPPAILDFAGGSK